MTFFVGVGASLIAFSFCSSLFLLSLGSFQGHRAFRHLRPLRGDLLLCGRASGCHWTRVARVNALSHCRLLRAIGDLRPFLRHWLTQATPGLNPLIIPFASCSFHTARRINCTEQQASQEPWQYEAASSPGNPESSRILRFHSQCSAQCPLAPNGSGDWSCSLLHPSTCALLPLLFLLFLS